MAYENSAMQATSFNDNLEYQSRPNNPNGLITPPFIDTPESIPSKNHSSSSDMDIELPSNINESEMLNFFNTETPDNRKKKLSEMKSCETNMPRKHRMKITQKSEEFVKIANIGYLETSKGVIFSCLTSLCKLKSYDKECFKKHLENFHYNLRTEVREKSCKCCERNINGLLTELDHMIQHKDGVIIKEELVVKEEPKQDLDSALECGETECEESDEEAKQPAKKKKSVKFSKKVSVKTIPNNGTKAFARKRTMSIYADRCETVAKSHEQEKQTMQKEVVEMINNEAAKVLKRVKRKASNKQISTVEVKRVKTRADSRSLSLESSEPKPQDTTKKSAEPKDSTSKSSTSHHLHKPRSSTSSKKTDNTTDQPKTTSNVDIIPIELSTHKNIPDLKKIPKKPKKVGPMDKFLEVKVKKEKIEEELQETFEYKEFSENLQLDSVDLLFPWISHSNLASIQKSRSSIQTFLTENSLFSTYKCMSEVCSFYTTSLENFRKHSSTHDQNEFYCCMCLKKLPSVKDLCDHLKIDHKYSKFQCSKCMYRACHVAYVKAHQAEFHPDEKCNILKSPVVKIGKNVSENAKHEAAQNIGKFVQPYVCKIPKCKLKFYSKGNYISHLTEESNKSTNESQSNEIMQQLHAIDHSRFSSGKEGIYQCLHCEHGSDDKDIILSHLSMMHPNKFAYICERGELKTCIVIDSKPTSEEKVTHTKIVYLGGFKGKIKAYEGKIEALESEFVKEDEKKSLFVIGTIETIEIF